MKTKRLFPGYVYSAFCSLAGMTLLSAFSTSAAVVNVSVVNDAFIPASVTIDVNDQVTWTWSATDGPVGHSTTSDVPGLWDSGIQVQPFSFTQTFTSSGSFPYHCIPHAAIGMRGTVTVRGAALAPTIVTQPQSQTVAAGQNVTFSVSATGSPPLAFQWRFNGGDITGATRSSLALPKVQTNNAGSFSVVVSNATGSVTSADAVLTVQAVSTLPFVQGTYNGLFFDPNGVTQTNSGSFRLTTTAKGKFSGSLQNGGRRLSLSGQFDTNGTAQKTINRRNQSPLTVVLQLNLEDLDQITGVVDDGTSTAALSGDRTVFNTRQNPAPQAGQYTLFIPGSSEPTTTPGGDSFGTVTVDKAGKLKLAGSLADGTKMSQTTAISKHGDWPLYVPLYGGQGSILSPVVFSDTPDNDLRGNLVWIKPNVPKAKFYPGGFTLETGVVGFHCTRPASGQNVLNLANAQLVLTGGDLGQSITNQISLGARNKVTNLSSNKLTLTFKPATGLFSGRVVNPATAKQIPFNGAVLQGGPLGRASSWGRTRAAWCF